MPFDPVRSRKALQAARSPDARDHADAYLYP